MTGFLIPYQAVFTAVKAAIQAKGTATGRIKTVLLGEQLTYDNLPKAMINAAEAPFDPFKKAIYEPKGADVKPNYIITVNGYLLNQLKGLETKLKKGDHIALLPIVSGG